MADIKKLYQKFIINWADCHEPRRYYTVPKWYQEYHKIYTEVDDIRSRLKNDGKLKPQEDKEFLERLIYARHSGIANAGQSSLSKANFEIMIENQEFLNALEVLIKEPNVNNFEAFGKAWRQYNRSKQKSPLRINRVLAACTLEVSSTVHASKFDEVLKKLTSEGYIEPYKDPSSSDLSEGLDWFYKNQYLMRELHKKFKTKIENGEIDSIHLSIFVWELYLHQGAWDNARPAQTQAQQHKKKSFLCRIFSWFC